MPPCTPAPPCARPRLEPPPPPLWGPPLPPEGGLLRLLEPPCCCRTASSRFHFAPRSCGRSSSASRYARSASASRACRLLRRSGRREQAPQREPDQCRGAARDRLRDEQRHGAEQREPGAQLPLLGAGLARPGAPVGGDEVPHRPGLIGEVRRDER